MATMASAHVGEGPAGGNSPALFVSTSASRTFTTRPDAAQILACLDDTLVGDAILRQAGALAQALDLGVTAVKVVETPRHLVAPADPLEWQLRRREGRRRLDQLLALRARDAGAIDGVLLAGPAADELVGWAGDHQVALMALGTHERAGEEGGLGTTAQRVLERASASLLLVPASRGAPTHSHYHRILVALDGSARAESVLPIAVRIARKHGAELLLVHVVPRVEGVGERPTGEQVRLLYRQLARHNERSARDYLDGLATQMWRERLPVRVIVATDGDVRAELRRIAAEQGADLIIVSSHGKSAMADVPCGSVTEYLASHTPAPLLIVRPNFAEVFAASLSAGSRGAATLRS